MKDRDFKNIAKRLYDLEADPPTNGWREIGSAVQTSTADSSWIRKNWWTPLLIIPVFVATIITFNHHSKQNELFTELAPKATPMQSEASMIPYSDNTNQEALTPAAKQKRTKEKWTRSFKSEEKTSLISRIEFSKVNQIIEQKSEASNAFRKETSVYSTHPQLNNVLTEQNQDSVDSVIMLVDTLKMEENNQNLVDKEESNEKVRKPWRITASVKSQYSTKPSQPVANDEVMVTNIKKQKSFEQSGYGFTVGAGKALTKHFYMDGQLSIIKTERTTQFSYSNGEVDTLIAVQQPDQSVIIRPVYKIRNSEIINQFTYGGIHVTGSYYFWQKQHRRFSLTASAGAHYLLQSTEKERVNGEWSTYKYNNGNRINYSLMIGAGYSINFKHGWELTLSPTMMYYLKSPQRKELPYNFNLRSADLNIAVSKTLGH
jgi:hypothetical protein